MRDRLILGNWKMTKTHLETKKFIEIAKSISMGKSVSVGVAVPDCGLETAIKENGESPLLIGSQNISEYEEGAYTGETSARMLKALDVKFTLVGHSERRHIFLEPNSVMAGKLKQALKYEITPVFCVGETLDQKESGNMESVLQEQLQTALIDFSPEELKKMILAYEPVWAIGTGKAATPDHAEEAHEFIRNFLLKNWGNDVADSVRILYGGSVKAENISSLIQKQNIDGALVGGASLDPTSLGDIATNAKEA